MNHLALAFGYIGRLHAIRAALEYDLRDLTQEQHEFRDGAARLWVCVMNAWMVAHDRPARLAPPVLAPAA